MSANKCDVYYSWLLASQGWQGAVWRCRFCFKNHSDVSSGEQPAAQMWLLVEALAICDSRTQKRFDLEE